MLHVFCLSSLSVCLFVCPSVCLSIYLPTYLSTYLSISLALSPALSRAICKQNFRILDMKGPAYGLHVLRSLISLISTESDVLRTGCKDRLQAYPEVAHGASSVDISQCIQPCDNYENSTCSKHQNPNQVFILIRVRSLRLSKHEPY